MTKYNTEESIYYKNIKDASLFFDKTILTLSSVFLGFLFYQIKDLLVINNIKNIDFLWIAIMYIWLTIILVLISYIFTIEQATKWYEIEKLPKKKSNKKEIDKLNKKFHLFWRIIIYLNMTYFISFIFSIIISILFYITNLYNYV